MDNYLTGKLLLAMPSMSDTRFERAVIFICAHDEQGAMGLVINNALRDVAFTDMLEQIDLISDIKIDLSKFPVMNGGPVDSDRGFLLHSHEYSKDDTVNVNDEYGVTGTIDALREVVGGDGPDKMLFILGYAGWSAEQLDQELQQNAWLVADADPSLIFDTPLEEQWMSAVRALGVEPAMLSSAAGRA